MSILDTKRSTPIANPRGIGDFTGSGTFDTIAVNYIKTKNRGAVTIENAILNGSISGDVLGAPGGIATLDPSTGTIPPAQLGGALLTGVTNGLNTALGVGSLTSLAGGSGNTAVGLNSGHALTTGVRNVFLGDGAGAISTGSTDNTFLGYRTGALATTANSCVLVGSSAGGGITTSLGTTIVGAFAGPFLSTQNFNTLVGWQSGQNATADQLTFIGARAGQNHSNGVRDVFVGYQAGQFNGGGVDNSYVGYQAGLGNNGSRCTFIGSNAGVSAFGSDMTGVGSGVFAFAPSLCVRSTAVGSGAMGASNIGQDCVFVGFNAGNGAWGDFNVGVGSGVMATNQFGSTCTAIGYHSLFNAAAVSSAVPGNTALGYQSLLSVTTGTGNLGLGINSGNGAGGTSSDCIFIGRNAGALGTFNNSLCISTRGTQLPAAWSGTNGSLVIDTTGGAFDPLVSAPGASTVIQGPGIGIYASPLTGAAIEPATGPLLITNGIQTTGNVLFQKASSPGQFMSTMGPFAQDVGTSGLNFSWRVISGTVDAGGNPFGPNTGYTSTRTGTGQITVNFNTAFIALFAAHATIFGSSAATSIVIPTLTGSSATFQIRDSTAAAIDQAFFFTIIGQ